MAEPGTTLRGNTIRVKGDPIMPMIRVDILEGRPEEKVQELQEKLCATLSEVLGTPPEATHVIVEEHSKRNWSVGGVRYIDK